MSRYKSNGIQCLAVFLGLLPQLALSAQIVEEPLSLRNANYSMDVKLNVETHTVAGKSTLTWRNITSFPANELQFHLYYNAWRNNKSSFLNHDRYSFFRSLLGEYKDDEWAYCDVHSMKILPKFGREETDITSSLEFIQPDDGNEDDRTVLMAALPGAVGPGETISIEIVWESRVPRTFSRTGRRGDYYFLAQWFPKIGVFEADGSWNCHQFIQTEFYADFGVYDVRMSVPTNWTVGATGQEVSKNDNGDGTTTHQYYQEDVHDFTWVTSPYLSEHNLLFDEPGLPTVQMRLLLMPDHAGKRDRYFAATAAALKYYGTWFGAYPYGHVTIVDPAYGSGTGGMEYPTFFTGGTRWLSPIEMRSPEGVTVHECGHQFWYGIMANNEFEHAWMDEGFNTYSTTRTMEAAFPDPVLVGRYFEGFIPAVFPSVKFIERTTGADRFFGYYSSLKLDPMSTNSWQYGRNAYGLNSYDKPGMMLRTLENYLGWETFQAAISTYFDRFKFRHPRPQDFFDVVNEVVGKDMTWFFEQTYYSSNVFDYAVSHVESNRIGPLRGYTAQDSGLAFVTGAEVPADSTGSGPEYRSAVTVRRWGEAIFPITVKVVFENGDEVLEEWDGMERWHTFRFVKPALITEVMVDPEHKLTLDINYTNNTWMRNSPAEAAARKWTAKWMIWLQSVLEFFAFFV